MKTKHFYSIILLIIISPIGCNNESIKSIEELNEMSIPSTRSSTFSWIDCTSCSLPSGNICITPWAIGSSSTIPEEFKLDLSPDDGWTILDATVQIIGYEHPFTLSDQGVNYLIFYNTVSGLLKGFYYAESMTANNCGVWQLSTTTPTKLFNFASYFAEPINETSPQTVHLSTVTSNAQTKGFELGWNCFQIELSYDENSEKQRLNISGYSLNQGTIQIKGEYDSKSSGTLTTTTQGGSNTLNTIASAFGNGAKEWVKDQHKKHTDDNPETVSAIKFGAFAASFISDIASSGVSSFIKHGANILFGSLSGSNTTNSDLKFSTNGNMILSGTYNNSASGMIKPVSGLRLGTQSQDLGVWNLSTRPYYYTESHAEFIKAEYGTGGMYFIYRVKRQKTAPQIVYNPQIKNSFNIKTHNRVVEYPFYNGSSQNLRLPVDNNTYPVKKYGYNLYKTIYYSDSLTQIQSSPDSYTTFMVDVWPNCKTVDNKPALRLNDSRCNFQDDNPVYKVGIEVNTVINGHASVKYSLKSFIPFQSYIGSSARPYPWTKKELQDLGLYPKL